jgi:mRNA-degrading endonuclease RelE of RelBE toxin-antitoxin system
VPKLTILQSRDDGPTARAILIPPRIWEEFDSYDKNLKAKFVRTFKFLSRDIHHPSLRIEVIRQGSQSIYRARVDPQYRIHSELHNGGYYAILAIGPHRLQGIG